MMGKKRETIPDRTDRKQILADMSLTVSIVMLNTNGLNIPIKIRN